MSSLYLIDGHSYIYRAFHAIPYLSNTKGLPTNAVYGFTHMLTKLIREKEPDYLAVAFDSEKPTHRHEAYEAYKAHRPPMPDALAVQIPYIRKVVEALRIPALVQEGVEADDLIGSAAKKAEAAGIEVVIVSGDKDMFQLVSPRIRLYDSMKDKLYGEQEVREKFGVEPGQVVEILALMGDAVDNIPGVPGVGEKTASDLIRQFGSVDHLLARLEEVNKPKIRESLRTFSDQVRTSRSLARLSLDIPLRYDMHQLRRAEPDAQALIPLFTQLEFSSLLKGFLQPSTTVPADGVPLTPEFIQKAMQTGSVGVVAISTREQSGVAQEGVMAFCLEGGPGVYALLGQESVGLVKPLLENPAVKKVGHDLKRLFKLLAPLGIPMRGVYFDTMLASYLLFPHRRSHSLSDLGAEHLGRSIQEPRSAEGPLTSLGALACQAARDILDLARSMEKKIEERSQSRLYHDVELPLVEVLADMEQNGFKINIPLLDGLSKELDLQIQGLVQRIYHLAQGEFNLNSPKQLSEVLFQRLGLKPVKKTKTGYSTDEAVLSELAQGHELPAEILNYRQLAKLKSTYVVALPQMVNPRTHRVHTTFHQTVTATGRLSSSEPNLQNIPVRGEWGRRIRQAFIAGEGYLLLSSDYNQIELRILAHLSQDRQLVRAFQEGKDVHAETAANIFRLPLSLVTSQMRRAAKTVNFGVIYGMGPYALSAELGTSQAEARQYIDSYFGHYEGVKQFVEKTVQEVRRLGYVATLLNRRREVPEISAQNATTRALGERIAVNTMIQGSAADLMKLAMVRIFDRLKQANLRSKMILQIHDELIFDVTEEEVETMKALVKDQMENVIALSVPIKVDLGVGLNWAEIHS